jgi:hypothetical protein
MMWRALNFLRCLVAIAILVAWYPIAIAATAIFMALVSGSLSEYIDHILFVHHAVLSMIAELWRTGTGQL